jgi:mannobiose 2-epimerase
MIYEHWKDNNTYDLQRQWWVQCESVIGHVNLYQHFQDEDAFVKAKQCWDYIQTNLVDKEHGEWYWAILDDGTTNHIDDKAGFWKCPYHNSRMCLELIEREY